MGNSAFTGGSAPAHVVSSQPFTSTPPPFSMRIGTQSIPIFNKDRAAIMTRTGQGNTAVIGAQIDRLAAPSTGFQAPSTWAQPAPVVQMFESPWAAQVWNPENNIPVTTEAGVQAASLANDETTGSLNSLAANPVNAVAAQQGIQGIYPGGGFAIPINTAGTLTETGRSYTAIPLAPVNQRGPAAAPDHSPNAGTISRGNIAVTREQVGQHKSGSRRPVSTQNPPNPQAPANILK